MYFIFIENMKIIFINTYYNLQISENITHVSVINLLTNIDLKKIIQKVGGQMILCPRPFIKWGDKSPRPPPSLATRM